MDITTLVENGEYLEAATQAEGILEEGAYDIRITGFFLYGVFLEQGVGGLTAILQCLTKLFTENWDAVGPIKNREKHAQTSLNWFLRQLVKKLQYEEGKDSDVYQQWVAEVSSDEVQETLDASEELQGALRCGSGRSSRTSAGWPVQGKRMAQVLSSDWSIVNLSWKKNLNRRLRRNLRKW